MTTWALALLYATLSGPTGTQTDDARLKHLVTLIDKLDYRELEKLRPFGDRAFKLIYPIAQERMHKMRSGTTLADREKATALFGNAVSALTVCASVARTSEMTSLFGPAKGYARTEIFEWLAVSGDPKPNQRIFQHFLLVEARDHLQARSIPAAVQAVMRGNPVSGIRFLTLLLKNPKAPNPVKSQIVIVFGKSRNEEAFNAIRESRRYTRTIAPILDRRPFGTEELEVKARAKDAKGIEWGLVEWNGMGNPSDVWLVRRRNGRWAEPIFTGFSESWPRWHPSGIETKGGQEHHAKLEAYYKSTDWLPGSPNGIHFDLDSDQDGYTDLVEKWLGLDPHKADTDRDGLLDGIDKNPLAASPPDTDEEKAIHAVFEIYALREPNENSNCFVTLPTGMKPIELASWSGLVLLRGHAFKEPTRPDALYGLGLTFSEAKVARDRKSAEVQLKESGGYYENQVRFRLEKHGNDWFVVDQKTIGGWIS